jgi:flagellar motility protein MotE (MotC chaperone)
MNLVHLKSFLYRIRLIPLLIIVASLGFIIRVGDTYFGIKSLSGSARAEETAQAALSEATEPSASQDKEDKPKTETATSDKIDLPSIVPDESASEVKWKDASDTDLDESDIKDEVFQDLAKRRQAIAAQEKRISEREALLEAAQKELDKKVKEMEGLRDELRSLLKEQTAEEATRLQSLVKIYSSMKPKDAARIFNTLDTDILMDVIGGMPESKSGPIIALMEADRARALTTLLAEQKKLPEVP